MVTLQANHQQQVQQQLQSSRLAKTKDEHEANVVDANNWDQGENNHNEETNEINAYDKSRSVRDDHWSLSENSVASLNVGDNDNTKICNGDTKAVVSVENEIDASGSGDSGNRRIGYSDVFDSVGESTQCSETDDDYNDNEEDDDEEDEEEEDISNGWVKQKVITSRVQNQTSFGGGEHSEVLPNLDETTFGEVNITNSRHVHVGNTNFYKGPVTIKQFVYTNASPINDKQIEGSSNGGSSGRSSDVSPNNDGPVLKNDSNTPIYPTYSDYDSVTKWLWTWRCVAILSVLSLSLITIVVVVSMTFSGKIGDHPPRPTLPDSPTSGVDPDENVGDSVKFVERAFWNAQPPTEDLDKLEISPTPYVVISHTASQPCYTQSACSLSVRLAQTLHIEGFKFSDIGYNFLVGGDGQAYVGRGWDHAGAHAFGWNYNSIGISFIGTFNDVVPPKRQIRAALKVIEKGVELGKILPNYKVLGHRQTSPTLSPGNQLYKIITTWSHWSPYPPPHDSSRASTSRYPHFFAISSSLVLIIPHLLNIIQMSSKFFFYRYLDF